MSEPSKEKSGEGSGAKSETKPKKQWKNPALRAMGIPRFSLPSRNWLIFWSVLASIGGGIAYDKYEQSKIRTKYMEMVQPLSQEQYSIGRVPRKLTIFITPPPNDFLDASLKLFRKYIKPVLNSAALDFDIFSESRQGDIRATVAQQIRDLRLAKLEQQRLSQQEPEPEKSTSSWKKVATGIPKILPKKTDETEPEVLVPRSELYSPKDVLGLYHIMGSRTPVYDDQIDPATAGGVICIGRGAYKEYMTGVHEGLLGPLEKPQFLIDEELKIEQEKEQERLDKIAQAKEEGRDPEPEPVPLEDEDAPKPVVKPYIKPEDYANAELAPELNMNEIVMTEKNIPAIFEQPLYVYPVPNLLGFTKIPWKIYRYYTKRYLADDFGERALNVIENKARPFEYKDVFQAKEEELDWPKKWVQSGIEKNSEWVQELQVDDRVTTRMRVFDINSKNN